MPLRAREHLELGDPHSRNSHVEYSISRQIFFYNSLGPSSIALVRHYIPIDEIARASPGVLGPQQRPLPDKQLDSMEASTLSSAGKAVPYMRMTDRAIPCQEPIMAADFKECRIPGGVDLWTRRGFYSPGVCFVGYMPHCTQTIELSDAWPLRDGETTVRCIPE